MFKSLMTFLVLVPHFAFSSSAVESLIECDLSSRRLGDSGISHLERIVIQTGHPGSITLITSDSEEILFPKPGVGGIFNELDFSSTIDHVNDARRSIFFKTTSSEFGEILASFKCEAPNSLFCDTRGGLTKKSNVVVRIEALESILNFNSVSLPLCHRSVLF